MSGLLLLARAAINHRAAVTYATWNPSDMGSSITLSAGNSRATAAGGGTSSIVRSNTAITVKTYFELLVDRSTFSAGRSVGAGACDGGQSLSTYIGQTGDGVGRWAQDGSVFQGGSITFSPGAMPNPGTIGVAIDPSTRKVWLYDNSGSAWIGGGDPATGTGPTATLTGSGSIYAAATPFLSPCFVDLVSNPANMIFAPPSGFTAGF